MCYGSLWHWRKWPSCFPGEGFRRLPSHSSGGLNMHCACHTTWKHESRSFHFLIFSESLRSGSTGDNWETHIKFMSGSFTLQSRLVHLGKLHRRCVSLALVALVSVCVRVRSILIFKQTLPFIYWWKNITFFFNIDPQKHCFVHKIVQIIQMKLYCEKCYVRK